MLFCNVLEVADRQQSQGTNDGYWNRSLKQLLRNLIDLVAIARDQVQLMEMYEALMSAPMGVDQMHDEAWKANSALYRLIMQGENKSKTARQAHDWNVTARYWLAEFPNLSEKTRSIIVSMFTSMSDCFLRGVLHDLFCTTTTVTPEDCYKHGKIIVMDLPLKGFSDLGLLSQVLFKYVWQRALERRDLAAYPRPCVLWADECQYFINAYDQEFLSTSRGAARVATVFLSQGVPSFYAALGGGDRARHTTDSLLGLLSTKMTLANNDPTTNNWAAEVISKDWTVRSQASYSSGDMDGPNGRGVRTQHTAGGSQSLEHQVPPIRFTTLRTGGPANELNVDAYVVQAGRLWKASGKNYLKTIFRQDFALR
jgi:hypothetical protein